jgi:predicted Zn finger-like uncharacterized protein
MLLATRCPFCETVFRIQPTQLAVRRGLVRCGHCQEAFDASGSLFEVPEGGDFTLASPVAAEIAASLTAPPSPEPASEFAAKFGSSPAAAEPAQEAPPQLNAAPNFANRTWDPWAPPADSRMDPRMTYSPDQLPGAGVARGVQSKTTFEEESTLAREPQETPAAAVAPVATPAPAAAQSQPEPAEPFPPATRWTRVEPDLGAPAQTEPTFSSSEASATAASDPEPTLGGRAHEAAPEPAFSALSPNEGAAPFAVTREAPATRRGSRRLGWRIFGTLIAILLFVMLIVQLAWWQRETVMVYWPDSQPLYQQACEQLGCRVLPPRDIDGLLVEPSDLRQVDNEPHHLELKVPLRNRFNVSLAYPAIELTLLDRQNNIVVRRVLWPQDYVTPGTPIEAGLPARTTQTMIVRLDTGDVVASNFRIEIFYP